VTATAQVSLDSQPESTLESTRNPWSQAIRRLLRSPGGKLGAFVLGLFCFIAITASFIAPYDPLYQFAGDELLAPNSRYLLGTDEFGRDLLSRIIYGTRTSLSVSMISAIIGFSIGVSVGLFAGYVGGWFDALVNRIWDTLLAFPVILLGIAVVVAIGPGVVNAAIAVGITNIPIFARLARACVLTEKERDYVLAVRNLGGTNLRIVFRHIFPNALSSLIVQTVVAIAYAVLLESSLSFLGLGAQPPEPSWGAMLSTSRPYLRVAPWYGFFPGLALTLFLIGLNYFSDAVRDALDPRLITQGK